MRTLPVGLAAALFALAIADARVASADDGLSADPPPSTPAVAPTASAPPPRTTPEVWYGDEILFVDLVSDLTLIGAAYVGNGGGVALGFVGAGGYFAGAPIIHAMHHRSGGIIAGSVALRLTLPILGAVIGAGLASCSSNSASSGANGNLDFSGLDCALSEAAGAVLGFAAGMVTAQITDAAFLSTAPAHAAPSNGGALSLSIQPNVGTLRDSERRVVPTFGVTVSF
jgi:hypothetical protein